MWLLKLNKELGILCKGYFFNGNLDGKGEMVLSDGSYYEGDFVNGYKFGEGKEIFPNGDEYEGEFVNHVFEGHGVLKYNNGNIYDGEFKCGRKDGEDIDYLNFGFPEDSCPLTLDFMLEIVKKISYIIKKKK